MCLDDYDEIDEDKRMDLSHIISGYLGTASSATTSLSTSTSSSVFPVRPYAKSVDVVACWRKANYDSYDFDKLQTKDVLSEI